MRTVSVVRWVAAGLGLALALAACNFNNTEAARRQFQVGCQASDAAGYERNLSYCGGGK
jgi:uncharacterized membrane protein YphA (DoxX/SURF4 family)